MNLKGMRVIAGQDAAITFESRETGEVIKVTLASGKQSLTQYAGLSGEWDAHLEGCIVLGDAGNSVTDSRSSGFGSTAAAQSFVPSAAYQHQRIVADVTAKVLQQQRINEQRRTMRAKLAVEHGEEKDQDMQLQREAAVETTEQQAPVLDGDATQKSAAE